MLTLSGLGSLIIVSLLLLVYRSPMALLLGLLPVLSGALAGVAAVSLGFGMVHGVTLGFGIALIGEAVDYSIYLLMQSERTNDATSETQSHWNVLFWPTIRIGVLTSVFGFASLLFSSFPGLAQLGLFAITGLVTAALVTRFVLPTLLPAGPASARCHVPPAAGCRSGLSGLAGCADLSWSCSSPPASCCWRSMTTYGTGNWRP